MKISKKLKEIMLDINSECNSVSPRALKIYELINYKQTFKNAQNLIASFNKRKYSFKYMAAELLWYLSGSLDTDKIGKYAKLWLDIANEEGTVNSNYGYIVLYRFIADYYNQYNYIIEKLKEDKDSRQALIRYNAHEHVYKGNKDFTCFPSSTLIHSPEGNITIGKLYKKFKEGNIKKYPVYSFNEKTKETEIKRCTNAIYNGKGRLLKITLDNGSSFKCTPNHLILVKSCLKNTKNGKINRIWKRADELIEGDIPQKIKYINGTNEILKKSDLHNHYDNRFYIHREYYKFLNKYEDISNKDIHHIDLNRYNNGKNNLLSCNKEQHIAIHQVQNNSNSKIYNNNDNALNIRIMNYKSNRQIDYIEQNNNFTKISKIENLHRKNHNLFDIEVEDNNNFFINGGVCVHNCTISNQFFIRKNKLDMIVNMRSNDLFFGFQYDIVWFGLVLQSIRLDLLDVYPNLELGNIYYNAGSMHIYESFMMIAIEILTEDDGTDYNIVLNKSLLKLKKDIQQNGTKYWYDLEKTKDYKQFIKDKFYIDINQNE